MSADKLARLAEAVREAQRYFMQCHDRFGALLADIVAHSEGLPKAGEPTPAWPRAQPAPPLAAAEIPAKRATTLKLAAGRRTTARIAIIEREYPAGSQIREILAMVNALPAPAAMTQKDVRNIANRLGLRRADGFFKAMHLGPDDTKLFSAARDGLIAGRYPAEGASEDLLFSLNKLPGIFLSNRHQVTDRAKARGVRRDHALDAVKAQPPAPSQPEKKAGPLGLMPPPVPRAVVLGMWTPARDAVIRAEWPKGTSKADVWAKVCALPGPPITNTHACAQRASSLGIRRPTGYGSGQVKRAPQPRRADVMAPSKPSAATPRTVIGAPIKFAKPAPRVAINGGAAPLPATPTQLKREADAKLVADHIASKGVTRCPIVALEATCARIPEADSAVIRERNNRLEQQRQDEASAHSARIKVNRSRKAAGLPPIEARRTVSWSV